MTHTNAPSSTHQAVERALQVITRLGQNPRGITLLDLSSQLGMPKPTLHRILSAMKSQAFASQPESGGGYFLGPAALEAAFTFHSGMDLRSLLHPLLLSANQLFDQTCHLASLDGGEVVYLDKVDTSARIRLSSVVGGRNPAHATGVGKAMLAATFDDPGLAKWVAENEPLLPRTANTVTDLSSLASMLAVTRNTGYAVDDEESEPGLLCVAVSIPLVFDHLTPPLAVSVTGLKRQMLDIGIDQIGATLTSLVSDFPYGSRHSNTTREKK